MITKIMGEAPFQVLTNNFSISPSNEGYTLQISADGKNFSNLFQVGANVTRLVTGVAANSYYRLLGNDSEVSINWMKTCVTEGGGSGSGVTPEEVQAQIDSALTVYTPTANFATINGSAITSGGNLVIEFEDKTLIDFDKTTQAERADLYTTLKALYDGGSGATINKTYDFYKTVSTKQGLKIDYYGFSGNTLIFGKVVSPDNPEDQVAYAQVMTIQSDGSVSVVSNTIGGVDLSDYYTSAQTESAITMAVSGKADAANVTANTGAAKFPNWNSQGIITGFYGNAFAKTLTVNGVTHSIWRTSNQNLPTIYAPANAGTAGDILVSTGNGAPVWSAVTFISSADVETQINGVLTAYTPTTNIATVNGSALTNGGNIVIEGGADMSGYWTSAQTQTYVNNQVSPVRNDVNDLRDDFDIMDEVVADALNDLNANLATKVGSESVTTIWKGTQQEYNAIVNPDSSTLYIIID